MGCDEKSVVLCRLDSMSCSDVTLFEEKPEANFWFLCERYVLSCDASSLADSQNEISFLDSCGTGVFCIGVGFIVGVLVTVLLLFLFVLLLRFVFGVLVAHFFISEASAKVVVTSLVSGFIIVFAFPILLTAEVSLLYISSDSCVHIDLLLAIGIY
jgi:hypothetical protein